MIVSLYLVFHLMIQTIYQFDRLCPYHLWNDKGQNRELCRTWAKSWFDRWFELMNIMSRVITFLLGFFVATNTRRWWEQVTTGLFLFNVYLDY